MGFFASVVLEASLMIYPKELTLQPVFFPVFLENTSCDDKKRAGEQRC